MATAVKSNETKRAKAPRPVQKLSDVKAGGVIRVVDITAAGACQSARDWLRKRKRGWEVTRKNLDLLFVEHPSWVAWLANAVTQKTTDEACGRLSKSRNGRCSCEVLSYLALIDHWWF